MRAVVPAGVARHDTSSPPLGGPKQRLVLALLLAEPNGVVSVDRLVDDVWDDAPPSTARHTAQAYVSELRKGIGPQIERHGAGYMAAVDRTSLDTIDFEARVAAGRSLVATDPAAAAEELGAALALWRGEPFEEFAHHDAFRVERTRLEEMRVSASEDLVRARLALGQHDQAIIDLVRLTDQHPYREELRALHMLALYQSGRQADALREFQRARRVLADDLGISPGPRLSRLQEQILLQDPALETARRAEPSRMPGVIENPYLGLRAFQEADESRFFGRDDLIERLVDRVRDDQRLTAVVGPSGSGKSSVVQAGLVPRVQREFPTIRVTRMQPGSQPFAELDAAIARSLGTTASRDPSEPLGRSIERIIRDASTRLLLVIDQFEELYTMTEPTDADRFVDALLDAIDDPDGRLRVILTLRADFYDRPLGNPRLGGRFSDNVVNVVSLSPDQLEAAATRPAQQLGIEFEPRLVGRLIADVAGQPNALPLFQFSLTELFDERTSTTLELGTYERIGGVRKSVARRAESIYERLDPDEQAAARQLLLRIATISDGVIGRRRVPASELVSLDVDVVTLQSAIDAFTRHRLLALDRDPVSGEPTIEVAHEALLAEWTRLRDWIDQARIDLTTHAAFASAVREWNGAQRNEGYLLTGSRLDDYEAWAATTQMSLTTLEREFLDASTGERARAAADSERRRRDEARRRRRSRLTLLALAAVAALLVGVIAYPLLTSQDPDTVAVALTAPREESMFDELVADGVERAAMSHGFDVDVIEPPFSDAASDIRATLATNPKLVFSVFLFADTMRELAPDFPDSTFVSVDVGGEPTEPNIVHVDFATEQAAFLVGAAAALQSESGRVGYIGANSMPHLEQFRSGFESGVAAAGNGTEVVSRYVRPPVDGEPWNDGYNHAGIAEQMATTMYRDEGVDVIFAAAGRSGEGVARAATDLSTPSRKLWMIGVDNDQVFDLPDEQRAHILTSMLKRFDVAIAAATDGLLDGSIEPGRWLRLGLAEGAVGYTTSGDHLDPATIDRLDALTDDIVSGRISIDGVPDGPADTAPLAVAPDAIDVAFDGDSCVLDRTPTMRVGVPQQFVFSNDAEWISGLMAWTVPDGFDPADGPNWDGINDELVGLVDGSPGGESVLEVEPTAPGSLFVMCVDDFDHPAAVLDVLPA